MRHFECAIIVVVCNLAVFAQDGPKAEIFAGFSYANYELIPGSSASNLGGVGLAGPLTASPSGRLSLIGWNGSATIDLNRWFGFATDFSGYYSSSSVSTTRTGISIPCLGCPPETTTIVNLASSPKVHNFLFGPQISYPSSKIRPFAHFLVGGEHLDLTRSETVTFSARGVTLPPILVESGHSAITGFAMVLGGGVDYSINHRLALRLESDYLTGQGTGQNHVRVSTGLVWRLGN